jgi:hypothetical protein
MDCGTPPGGPAEVGDSVEEETEGRARRHRGGGGGGVSGWEES